MLLLSVLIIPARCPAQVKVPADYQAYFDGVQAQKASKHADAVKAFDKVLKFQPDSPLKGKAALASAECLMAGGTAIKAVSLLASNYKSLPQPEGDSLLARATESAGDRIAAAGYWQRVYYAYPLSKQAVEADAELARLHGVMGANFPPAMPQAVLDRAETLRRAGQASRAKQELLKALSQFAGLEREQALIRASFGDYKALDALSVKHPEAEAERIYLMHAAARRNSMESQAEAAVKELDRRFPDSKWTMEALISWGNHYLIRNDSDNYVPLYKTCADRFPTDPQAAYCHWKVVWNSWIRRAPEAKKLMAEHLTRFPESEKTSAALYFLGRYREAVARYPNSWYAVLSRSKLKGATADAQPDPALFTPTSSVKERIARAKQLEAASLQDWAEFELKHAAEEQPFVAAMNLAQVAASRGAHDQALRYIKGVAKGYLMLPFEAAPEPFWRLAFPLPYRKELETNSRARGLDPHLIAALIRQESEFNPRAVSRAKAYGLTQVLPSTGRQLSRRLGIRNFRPSMLFQPAINLKFGTSYLKSMLDAHDGRWELTLASYNAGKSRTDNWITWYKYREPAEFVETVPFTETRNYIQAVLRNADLYDRLYGQQGGGTSRRAASYP